MSEGGLLTVSELSSGYGGAPVLHKITFSLPRGRITALLGANGAGKTTLLRTVSGLLTPTSGTVALDGRDITALPVEERIRLGLAHVPEGRGVIGELTVDENLRLGALWRRDQGARRQRMEEVYQLFPSLAQRRGACGQNLSGGEQQMLVLGRAMMADPVVLLLDEPSLGLAALVAGRVMGLLRQLCDSTGLTVLLAEQNVRSALAVADHGAVISLGRIVVEAEAGALRGNEGLYRTHLGL